MPIIIPRDMPAFDALTRERIFVMSDRRAERQDIRPLEIAILNLMPTKVETETQLMRMLSNTPLQINVTLIKTATYRPSNASKKHMDRFYRTFDEVRERRFDGLIVTGAPLEKLEFDDVKYWDELCRIMDYADRRVTSSIFICWSAQAALSHYYGIRKIDFDKKLFGIFENRIAEPLEPILRGLNDIFMIPHSRYAGIDEAALRADGRLVVLAEGPKCGISVAKSIDSKRFFFFGHSEYSADTLRNEYARDAERGLGTDLPENYFANGDRGRVEMNWRSTGTLLFSNWLNYYVYQVTPYDITGQCT